MRPDPKKLPIYLLLLALLMSCGSSNDVGFSRDTQILSSAEYGYSPENPVTLWAPSAQQRKQKKVTYLQGLRSQNGEKFEIIEKDLVPNPNFQSPGIKIYNVLTDEVINKGKGEFIELYTLESLKEKDTINIYIAPHTRGPIQIPLGLQFAHN